ncbi:hypothetical protein PMI36_01443 [Pseudomonas sp. GM79]|nr:hypothetical protein PMI36_01443 [Pseudomonas sp. GM79]
MHAAPTFYTERLILRPLELADAEASTALKIHCGSGLARESGLSVNNDVECDGLFASKPAPTLSYALNRTPGLARSSTVNSNTSGRA